ncbi:AraC family transcriptional regulator [Streptomyces melanogenes]|nr:AraC family transcriptional regulator [Streptomyces melanogenes]
MDIQYRNPHCPALGIDVGSLSALRKRSSPQQQALPQRLDFHLLVLVTRGSGTYMIDFVDHDCGSGTLLWIRPGQVHRYPAEPGLEARLVLFTADFPPPQLPARALVDAPSGPAHWKLAVPDATSLTTLTGLLASEHVHHGSALAETTTELLRHLLAALLLRIALLPEPEGEPAPLGPNELFTRFRAELERSYATTRSVDAYAARLGVVPKTLTRACRQAVGRSAKQLVDARVVLEAKRLLVHTDLSASAVGRHLGFTEASHFGKFFARLTGVAPGDFRRGLGLDGGRPQTPGR